MFNKSIDIKRQLDLMKEYEITAEEWMVIELLFLATDDPAQPGFLLTYFNECKKDSFPLAILGNLKDKKILGAKYKVPAQGEQFKLEEIQWNDGFLTTYFKKLLVGGQELWDAYPKLAQVGGKLVSLTNITTKGYTSQDDLFALYSKNIRHSRKKHDEVMQMLQWAIEQKLIHYGIVEYIVGRKWEEHAVMRDSGDVGGFVLRIDTLQDV
jgi:hypothetical protein